MLDDYAVTALLARGGMASVFKAMDCTCGRIVALKVPHIQYESDVVFYERFRREEQAALRLDHPNVMKALSPRGAKSRMYMVLEYVDGVPLSSMLRGEPLPTAQAVDIARQVCDALAYLHAQGIFHRDIKPGNILLTPAGQVKILDLGIAHMVAARRLTISGLSATLGTPDYMAPEQMRGRTGDERVDIYALGTMLYQMLTGRLPYPPGDWDALLRAKRLEAPAPPSTHVASLDPGLEAIVLNAIQPAPADRYAVAVDMLADLRNPSSARLRPAAEASQGRRPRRNLRPWAAAAAILLALSGIGWIARVSHRRVLETTRASAASPTAEVMGRRPGTVH